MERIKHLFIPTEKNNYHAHLIRRPVLFAYLVALLLLNSIFGSLLATPVSAAVDAATLYELHNEERARLGLNPLRINTDLIASANAKADVMLENDCWSHYCPEGTSPWVFFDGAGYNYIFAGENLAEGFRENGTVMTAWMNSPTHRANVVKPEFNEIGIGFATGYFQGIPNNTIVVVHFGSRTNAPSTLPTTGDDAAGGDPVIIRSPQDGAIVNDPLFEVSGTAPTDSTVELESNQRQIGRVEADGPNFTFRPSNPYPEGSNKLQAKAFDGDSLRGVSDAVTVTVDTVAPEVISSSVRVNSVVYDSQEYAVLTVRTEGDPQTVTSNLQGLYFHSSQDIWEGEVSKQVLSSLTNLKLVATDAAGNQSSIELPTAKLLSEVLALEATAPRPDAATNNTLASFTEGFSAGGVSLQFNVMFIAFLLSLFGIDFYVLSKTGMTGMDRGKSHLHIPVLILLIIIALVGGAGGTILTGTATI